VVGTPVAKCLALHPEAYDVYRRRLTEMSYLRPSSVKASLESIAGGTPDSSYRSAALSAAVAGNVWDSGRLQFWGIAVAEGIDNEETGKKEDTAHVYGVLSLHTNYGDASVGAKWDRYTGETAIKGNLDIDPAFLGFRFVRPTSASLYGQLLQGGPRFAARAIKGMSPQTKEILGVLALQYQRVGRDFDAGVFEALSLHRVMLLELAHDFGANEFRSSLSRINVWRLCVLGVKGEEGLKETRLSSQENGIVFFDMFLGPVASYYHAPGRDGQSLFGGGIEFSATASYNDVQRQSMALRIILHDNYVEEVRLYDALAKGSALGVSLSFGATPVVTNPDWW